MAPSRIPSDGTVPDIVIPPPPGDTRDSTSTAWSHVRFDEGNSSFLVDPGTEDQADRPGPSPGAVHTPDVGGTPYGTS
ncbi:hypothetical protein ACL02R_14390 [Streptomyces sp. MS19]|uniref:hypothetical protein n=1 Tax=Streptomyces sp. MS19 TaxID=3385972 RepID=UPI00399F4EB4